MMLAIVLDRLVYEAAEPCIKSSSILFAHSVKLLASVTILFI